MLPPLLLLGAGGGVNHQSTDCGGNGRTSVTTMVIQGGKGNNNYARRFLGGAGSQGLCGARLQMGIKKARAVFLKGMVAVTGGDYNST